jgi:WD40 repeat protein
MARDPAERYATAEELAADLRRFLADRPIQARRTPWHERTWRWCRRNPLVATLSGALLLLLTVTAVAGVVMSVRLYEALGQAQTDRDTARAAVQDGKHKLFESLVSEAKAQRFSGRLGQRFGTLASIRKAAALARELELPAATFDELRNLAIAALALPDIHIVKEWDGWPGGSHDLSFDEHVQLYARGDVQGNLTVRRLADDVEIARAPAAGPKLDLRRFAEEGRALLFLDLGPPTAFPLKTAALTTADQKLLVTLTQGTGVVSVYERASGKHLHDISFGKWKDGALADCVWPAWDAHPWKHQLALAMGPWGDPERQVVRILDLDQGKVEAELVTNPRRQAHGTLSWHPDGRTLAVGYSASVVLWDVPSRKELSVIDTHRGGGLYATMSRSGQLLSTFSHWGGGVRLWHPYTGKPLLSLPGMNILPISSAADGRIYGASTAGTRLQLWATEPSPVLRLLVRSPIRGPSGDCWRVAVHPEGRLVALGSARGVSLFDPASGLDVGHLDIGYTWTAQFDPARGDLLTFNALGLLRWPVRTESASPRRLRIGPPTCLLTRPAGFHQEFRLSRDGRTIAVGDLRRVLVLHDDQPDQPVILAPVDNMTEQLTISPDGRWVATGCGGGYDFSLRVFDARSGQEVKSQRVREDGCGLVQFTPDGTKLLAGTRNRCRYWHVGTWDESEVAIDLGGQAYTAPEFRPNGKLMARESGQGAVRLLDAAGGQELARLESPDQGHCAFTTFSPDGRYLVANNGDFAALHVWDLCELRRQLKELDLDWQADPDPPTVAAPPSAPGTAPFAVEIDIGPLVASAKQRETARLLNNDAWYLVTGPHEQHDPVRALELIRKAVEADPNTATYWNTLGVVQYRNGQYREAAATLEKSLAAGKGESDACDLFFLAMCRQHLGDAATARDCYNRALKWQQGQTKLLPDETAELKAFQAEAEALLGKPSPP